MGDLYADGFIELIRQDAYGDGDGDDRAYETARVGEVLEALGAFKRDKDGRGKRADLTRSEIVRVLACCMRAIF
jgi:hypothetical protein